MRPTTITLVAATGAAQSSPVPVNWRQSPFNMMLTLDRTGSTTGFTIEWTNDSPSDFASAAAYNSGALWFPLSTMTLLTADAYGSIGFPVAAIRLICDANGSDTGVLTIRQGQNS